MKASLYVHIPLCLKKCDYCDFFSVTPHDFPQASASANKLPTDLIVSGLVGELRACREDYGLTGVDTVYIGGGTPSLLTGEDIALLCAAIREYRVAGEARVREWTIEANPEDITEEWLDSCARAGINRLSVGVQSLENECLSAVSRRGNAEKTIEALSLVSRVWKGRLSVDLIAGLPGQTKKSLISNLEKVSGFHPDHVSLYSLTIESGTPLARKLDSSLITTLPDEDMAADIWISGRDWLESNGFAQYEVSNFAKPGYESLHNMTYWHLNSYVGVGPGATGTIVQGDTGVRFTNTKDIDSWLTDPRMKRETETITRKDLMIETVLMGMRLASGISKNDFLHRFGTDIFSCIPKTLQNWAEKGLLETDSQRLALTKEGLLFLNRFLSDCMNELL